KYNPVDDLAREDDLPSNYKNDLQRLYSGNSGSQRSSRIPTNLITLPLCAWQSEISGRCIKTPIRPRESNARAEYQVRHTGQK
ncbi:hypothetical protein K0M31_017610, partial [Melipona bicolor]